MTKDKEQQEPELEIETATAPIRAQEGWMSNNKKPRPRGKDGRFLKQDPAPEPVVETPDVIDEDSRDEQGQFLAENKYKFDSQTGRQAVEARWERRRIAAEEGLILAAAEYLDKDPNELTIDDAAQLLIKRQGQKAIEDSNTPAAKLVWAATDSAPRGGQQQSEIRAQNLTLIQMNFRSLDDLQNYIEQQREAGRIANAHFVEAQFKELDAADEVSVNVLIGGDK